MTRFFRLIYCLMVGLFAGATGGARAQGPPPAALPPAVDSLRRLLTTPLADTQRLSVLHRLARMAPQRFDGLPYATEGLRLARKLKNQPKEEDLLSLMSTMAYMHQDFVTATRYAQALLRRVRNEPGSYLHRASAANVLGNIAGAQGHYAEARRYFWQSVRLTERVPPSGRQVQALAYGYSSLASGYLYELQQRTPRPDSLLRQARFCNRQVVRLANTLRQNGDERSYRGYLANSWDGLSDLAALTNRLDSALYYKRKALAVFQTLGDKQLVLTRQQHLANLELSAGHPAAAAALARQAQQAAHAGGNPVNEADATETLALALDKLGRGHEAFGALRRATVLRDTALGADQRAALAQLQVRFDTERKEARIRALTQQGRLQQLAAANQQQRATLLLGGLLVLALALVGGTFLYLRLRRSQAQLTALTATKDRLYALVAHDLRGPVQALDGLGNMIAYYVRKADIAAVAALPPLVSKAVSGINQLLDNLLHWAASQTGELRFEPTAQPVAVLLHECANLWNPTALANQVALTVLPAPPDDHLWADPQMVRTVLRNLVGNALKFTPSGGTVALEAAPGPGAGYTLRIADTGPGLSAADVATLLGPEAGPTGLRRDGARGEKGTGLGVRLCLLFMRRHGGTLALHGRPEGGTRAEVWFPKQP